MLYFHRLWNVSDGTVWFSLGFERFWVPNVVFPQVLKGFWWNGLVFLRFWKVFGAKCCIFLGFQRFLMKSLVYQRCWKLWVAKAQQNFQSNTFHYQMDALWAISELQAPRSPPELPTHHFSLSNRCLLNHSGVGWFGSLKLKHPWRSKPFNFLWFSKEFCGNALKH